MTAMKRIPLFAVLPILLATGCIHTENTEVRDEGRVSVQFENDAAGKVFYEALSHFRDDGRKTEQSSEVHIPVVFSHKHKVVRGANFEFNRAVRRCDTNQDRLITESEARIFAGTVD